MISEPFVGATLIWDDGIGVETTLVYSPNNYAFASVTIIKHHHRVGAAPVTDRAQEKPSVPTPSSPVKEERPLKGGNPRDDDAGTEDSWQDAFTTLSGEIDNCFLGVNAITLSLPPLRVARRRAEN